MFSQGVLSMNLNIKICGLMYIKCMLAVEKSASQSDYINIFAFMSLVKVRNFVDSIKAWIELWIKYSDFLTLLILARLRISFIVSIYIFHLFGSINLFMRSEIKEVFSLTNDVNLN